MLKLPERINHPYSSAELAGINKVYSNSIVNSANVKDLNRVNYIPPQNDRNNAPPTPQQNVQRNIQPPPQQNVQRNIQPRPQQNVQRNIQPRPQQNVQRNIQPPPQQNVQRNIQPPPQQVQRTPPPAAKPAPSFTKPVKKGMKVPIFTNGNVTPIKAGVGWKIHDGRCDVDVSAFLLDMKEKVISEDWFVFYSQPNSPDRSVVYNQNDPVYEKSFDIDLNKINTAVQKIVFVVTIDEALKKALNFSMLSDAYIKLTDAAGNELLSFCLTDYYSNVTSMMLGEIYNNKGQWKFNAIGNGIARDLAGLCEFYGIEII